MNLPSVLEDERSFVLVSSQQSESFNSTPRVAVPSNTAGTAAGPVRIIQSSLPFGR
jgi:hypothetical protein